MRRSLDQFTADSLTIICSLLRYPPDLLDVHVREIHANSEV